MSSGSVRIRSCFTCQTANNVIHKVALLHLILLFQGKVSCCVVLNAVSGNSAENEWLESRSHGAMHRLNQNYFPSACC
jgi:hypothetical protein